MGGGVNFGFTELTPPPFNALTPHLQIGATALGWQSLFIRVYTTA